MKNGTKFAFLWAVWDQVHANGDAFAIRSYYAESLQIFSRNGFRPS